MFAQIDTIDALVPHVGGNPQIRVKTEPNGMTVVCYMVQDEDTFAGPNLMYERECRGITFGPDGRIKARTLHKFFNVGEREDTLPENIDWSKVVRIMDKRDGSMITPVLMPDMSVKCKTKKSFTTKEAALADELLLKDDRFIWVRDVLRGGMTPTFEITSPKFPIVIKYDKDELTLLHVRENVSGRYLSEDEIRMALNPPFPIVENVRQLYVENGVVDWERLKAAAESTSGIEGWVIQFEDGDMVKLKTKWYCDLHHSVTFTRWRDIARTVCEDKADDLKGAFALTGRSIEPILKVERDIKARLRITEDAVEMHCGNGRVLNRTVKDMALAFKDHELFGLIMTQFRGKTPDYLSWYVKNHLDADWSLEVVGDEE